MTYTIPSAHSVGDPGHTTDHNAIAGDLALLGPPVPSMLGLAMQTLPLYGCAGTLGPAAQTLVLVLAQAQASVTLTKLGAWIDAAGVTPGAGVNRLMIYSEAGTLLGQTGDMTTAFEGTTYAEGTISGGAAVTWGANYYLGMVHNFTGTAPLFIAGPGLASYPLVRTHYPSVVAFGQSTVPASVTPSGMTPAGTPLLLTAGT